jgi:hypothetical protein
MSQYGLAGSIVFLNNYLRQGLGGNITFFYSNRYTQGIGGYVSLFNQDKTRQGLCGHRYFIRIVDSNDCPPESYDKCC